ncbi:hypothetical protein [Serratia fonticola]|jgi:hypothetical protein|uniref:hypothetical protein n=1 Tax=Serratia fonticola TaxID=47917 RepID=UPI00093EDEE6|nr:hypothetical protein [Serratia fonticola]OKP31366.1 hypothetical protein BSQ40_00445 [Serratia fonticola]
MTTYINFIQSDKAPFRFTASVGGQTLFITVLYNLYSNRYFVQATDDNNSVVLFTPMVASPPGSDINLALPYAPGTLIYRESTNNFEAT